MYNYFLPIIIIYLLKQTRSEVEVLTVNLCGILGSKPWIVWKLEVITYTVAYSIKLKVLILQ